MESMLDLLPQLCQPHIVTFQVMDKLVYRVEGLVGAEVKKLVRCEARKRRQEERQKK